MPLDDQKIDPPDHLTDDSRALWRRITEQYEIDAAAEPMLITFFENKERREEARKHIAEDAAVIKDRFGVLKVSPWSTIERDSTLIMQRSWRLLGFDQGHGNTQGELFK